MSLTNVRNNKRKLSFFGDGRVDDHQKCQFKKAVNRVLCNLPNSSISFLPLQDGEQNHMTLHIYSESSNRVYKPSITIGKDGIPSITCPCGIQYGKSKRKSCKHVCMILNQFIIDSISSIPTKKGGKSSPSNEQLIEFMKNLAIEELTGNNI